MVIEFACTPEAPPPRPTTSASQVDQFDKCERAWFFGSVLRIRGPSTKSQALGTSVHGAIEDFLNLKGEPTDPQLARMLGEAKKHLPVPARDRSAYVAEGEFLMDTYPGGPQWRGFIDLRFPLERPVRIMDYKTTSDRRYAKTPQDLAENVQMISYAKRGLDAAPDAQSAKLQHLYILTKGAPKAWVVETEVDRQHVEALWKRDLVKVRTMEEIRSAMPHPDDVRPNGVETGHCQAYGGCPHRERCGLSPESSLFAAFGGKPATSNGGNIPMSDFLKKIEELRNKTLAAQTAQGKPPTIPPPVTAAAPAPRAAAGTEPPPAAAPAGESPLMAALAAKRKADAELEALTRPAAPAVGSPMLVGEAARAVVPDLPAGAGLAGSGPLASTTVATPADHAAVLAAARAAATTVIPPDAPPRTVAPGAAVAAEPEAAAEDEAEAPAETPPDPVLVAKLEASLAAAPAPEASPAPETAPVTETPTPTGRKRGRPPKTAGGLSAAELERVIADKDETITDLREIIVEKNKELAQGVVGTTNAERDALLISAANQVKTLEKALGEAAKEIERLTAAAAPILMAQEVHLYVDALPSKGPDRVDAVLYEDWVAPIAQVARQVGKVEHWSLMEYGKGKGLLAAAIRAWLSPPEDGKEQNVLPRVMIIPSGAPGADVALEILTPLAKEITRGTR